MNALGNLAINSLWLAGAARSALKFRRALKDPRRYQEAILSYLLRRNADTAYGRKHHFHRLRSIRDYRDAVPVATYNDLTDEISRIKRGNPRVLTHESVAALEKTSGSTTGAKYIPYTARLMREFQAAIGPWMADLYLHRPGMFLGGAYWSVSPLASEREVTDGGLAVGFESDADYFGPYGRRLLSRLLATPPELLRIPDTETSRYVTLLFLLANPHLSFISVWNPSFLSLLIGFLNDHAEELISDVKNGALNPPTPLPREIHEDLSGRHRPHPQRALRLKEIFRHHRMLPAGEVWPRLAVISCWADAGAFHFLPELRRLFPGVEIQPKGLLATEGVVSIPLTGHPGAALAVTSHFLEFFPEQNSFSRPLLAHEIEKGSDYSVVITTGGGLYRYALGDRIRVVGKVGATPLVEFIGRSDDVSDLCGEKLHEANVRAALEKILRRFEIEPLFIMVAPEWGEPPGYVLYFEEPGLSQQSFDRIIAQVEKELLANPHYAYCRRLGQLGPIKGFRIGRGGNQAFIERCAALGQRRGNVKPSVLDRRTGWSDWFVNFTAEKKPRRNFHEGARALAAAPGFPSAGKFRRGET